MSSSGSSTPIPPSSTNFFSKPFDKSQDVTPAVGSSAYQGFGKGPQTAACSVTPSPSPFSIPPAMATSPAAGPATNTSKAFASILNTSTTNIFANPVSNPPSAVTAPPTSKTSNGTTDSNLKKYYTSLRGLNVSFLDFIKSSLESDAFSNLTNAMESYKTHRSQIQKDYDDSSEKEKIKFPTSTVSSPFGGFGSSTPLTNPFSSFKPGSESSSSTTSTNIFGPPPSGSLFGSSSSTSSVAAAFPTTSPSSDILSGISKPPSTDKISTSAETPNVFGSSASAIPPMKKLPFPFGSSSSTGSNPFGPPATNLFGSPATSTPIFGASAGNSISDNKPASSIPFGSPSLAAKNTGVFYAFGSGSKSASTPTKPLSAAASDGGSQETITEEGAAETGSEGAEPKESLPGLLTPNPHDEEGAGEENEETIHAVKLKAYRMRKASEQGGSGWAELGMGILRLKMDRDTGARRMLLRNSTNGKININFKIYTGLKPSISKKALTFVGHSDGVSQTFCVRLPSEEQADELKKALEREIEFVRAKEDS